MLRRVCYAATMLRSLSALVFPALVAAGCSPMTGGGNQPPQDLSQSTHDLQRDCTLPSNNRIMNPTFEMDSGVANNKAMPASSIGSWTGCCSMGTIDTNWTVLDASPRCGKRSVKVASVNANQNVLLQEFNSPSDAGHQFQLSGWFFVTTIDATGSIKLDIFDRTANAISSTTQPLQQTSSDWVQLQVTGTIPAGGFYQARISSSGNVEAYVDDVSLVVQ